MGKKQRKFQKKKERERAVARKKHSDKQPHLFGVLDTKDNLWTGIRKGHHYIEGKKCVTLDLASFEVYKKGEGTFTTFLREAHANNIWDATYIECVHNSRLRKWLERHGFHREPDSEPSNYYLWKHEPIIMPQVLVS